jgi:hypothetical protein
VPGHQLDFEHRAPHRGGRQIHLIDVLGIVR